MYHGRDRYGKDLWVNEASRARSWKGTAGGSAFCFSACDDAQTSADTSALAKNARTGSP